MGRVVRESLKRIFFAARAKSATQEGMLGRRLGGEWESHKKLWLAYPWDQSLWGDHLEGARREWLAFLEAVVSSEPVSVLVPEAFLSQAEAFVPKSVELRVERFGDIWIRDTGPLYTTPEPLCFRFNGWGGKFLLEGDLDLAERLAPTAEQLPFILEGGSIDSNGAGVLVTTEDCQLNPNRGSFETRSAFERFARTELGVQHVLWVKRGLVHDHTDGHIDNLARFVSSDLLVIAKAENRDKDPNACLLDEIRQELKPQCDALGIRLVSIPSAGLVCDAKGGVMPATHLNFYLNESRCLVPLYESVDETRVLSALASILPQRVLGLSARKILTGGGAFHCMTNQEMSLV
jgi:agmatine deiminase